MENQTKMQSQKNDGDQSDERKRRQIMGTWLSLSPAKIHLCDICKECFTSIKALWGHQNGHRDHKIHRMNTIILDREQGAGNKKQQRKVLERGKKDTSSSSVPPSKRARNDNTDAGNEIDDLELRVGSDPAPKKKMMKFHDFLGVKEGKGYDGAHSGSGVCVKKKINDAGDQNGANRDAVGVGAGGYESEPVAAAAGGSDNITGVDVTLKL